MKVITRETIAHLSTINATSLPLDIIDVDGKFKHWVGVGWVDQIGRAPADTYIVAEDIHTAVAALVTKEHPSVVHRPARDAAKARLFAYIYGKPDDELTLALEGLHPVDRVKITTLDTKD